MAIRPDTINDLGDFDHYQNKLKHFKKNATSEFQAVYDDENVDDKIQALTETYLERILIRCNKFSRSFWCIFMILNKKIKIREKLKHRQPFNHMVLPQAILLNSCYSIFLRNWLKYFPKEQIHLVNGNEISKFPQRFFAVVLTFFTK